MTVITDQEVLDFIRKTEESYPADANLASAADNRRYYDAMCAEFHQPRPQSVNVEDCQIDGVPVRIYRKNSGASDLRAVYLHGGGYVVGSLDSHDDVCAELCDISGCEITSVDYRLAPEYVYPAQLDDVERVWRHVSAEGAPAIIMGDSAGGNLSAALSVRMKRLNGPMPRGQILIYPSLSGETTLPSFTENAEAPLLRTVDIKAYRPLYTGGRELSGHEIPELAPMKAAEFSGLPSTWIITADIDPLRDDGPAYVEKLRASGVFAQCINEPQLVHGYLRARHMSKRARDSFQHIAALLTSPTEWC